MTERMKDHQRVRPILLRPIYAVSVASACLTCRKVFFAGKSTMANRRTAITRAQEHADYYERRGTPHEVRRREHFRKFHD